ncbi:MAG TPA: hypothetical protein VHY36_00475 [Steroidobacteraceae bacterium]|jgi:hypothetical protein|nr:hypothetical protein [Steroidobacteraceae bacterium]
MRTTLDIADDVLQAARERARYEKKTVGQVISELARRALTTPRDVAAREPKAVYGLRPFAPGGNVITNALLDKLREDDAY